MKYLAVMICVLFVIGIMVMPAFAENKTFDNLSETIRGENDSCPMLQSLYVAKTFRDVLDLPIVGKASYRAEIRYTSDINSITGKNSVMVSNGLEF
jgi:hypothetical protein